MEKRAFFLIGMTTLTICASAGKQKQPSAPIQEVPFTQVHLNDSFWSPRIEIKSYGLYPFSLP